MGSERPLYDLEAPPSLSLPHWCQNPTTQTTAAAAAARMATTLASLNVSTTRVSPAADAPNLSVLRAPWASFPRRSSGSAGRLFATGPSTPPNISERVSESIKKAEEACADDPASGECVALWDEVEELSAAASHARDKLKNADPLEDYCKDNPETEECRTYED